MFTDTGNGVMHNAFNKCANALDWAARKLNPVVPGGMDYVKLNVILFCIVLPVVLLSSIGLNLAWLTGLL